MSPTRPSIVVAPDKFKGSADAATIAAAIVAGLRDVWGDRATYVTLPMADGGEGTVDAFLAAGAVARRVVVRGPLGEPVTATYARDGDCAIIEMAAASGLTLLAADRAARDASTYGTGELIRDALDEGARHLVIGIGGSATTDGGAGALAALGVRFFADDDDELEPIPRALAAVTRIDVRTLDPRLAHVRIEIACDVENPLLGPFGAATVYGPQKGAQASDVAFLETMLARFAEIAVRTTGRDLRALPGAGAAGGLGYALATFASARLVPGVTIVGALRGLPAALEHAALCITGEGRIDEQTLQGKVIAGVAAFARAARVPVIAFAGSIDIAVEAALAERGIACVPIVPGPMSLAEAMQQASQLARAAAARFARAYRI